MKIWAWMAFFFIAAAGAGGYWVLESEDAATVEARGDLLALIDRMRLSEPPDNPLKVSAITPADTAVSAGSWVELAVKVQDGTGSPLADTAVHFAVDAGSGTLVAEATWTDEEGVARTSVRMPDEPGQVMVSAALPGARDGASTRFALRAGVSSSGSRMEYVGGDGQEAAAGEELPGPFTVVLLGADDEPMAGVEVEFEVASGGGSVSPTRTRTDEQGRASAVWRMGPRPGFHRLIAKSPASDTPVTFTAIATAPGARLGDSDGAAAEGRLAEARMTPEPPADQGEPGPVSDSSTEGDADPRSALPAFEPARSDPPAEAAPELRPGPVTVAPRALAVGGSAVCTIADGEAVCFGDGADESNAGGGAAPVAVAAGLFHVCALDVTGTASCWGANESGQIGDATRSDRPAPVEVATRFRFSSLAAGAAHTCGLTNGGRALCWGQNVGGQLGDGSREDRSTPGPVLGSIAFERLVAGWSHTCGLTRSGVAYCWGLNREGQIGDGSWVDRLEPREVLRSVRSLAAGSDHTCAIAEGRVLCWGDNQSGQLGDGSRESSAYPARVDLPGLPIDVAAGAAHTCALLSDGSVYCWGQNRHGQLGDGSTQSTSRPVRVAGAHVFRTLAAGGAVTCGRTEEGELLCWGLNQSGQLGDGTFTNRSVPTPVGEG